MNILLGFCIVAGVLFYICTYPYKFRLARKLRRVLSFPQVKHIKNTDEDFTSISQEVLNSNLNIEKKVFLNSKYVKENLGYTVITNKGRIRDDAPCLILLHGLRDSSADWLGRAKICENYLKLRLEKKIEPINIILIDSGDEGKSWYTNFYKEPNFRYEDYIIKELMPEFKRLFPKSKFGIAGFSMGGYGAFKLGLKYPELFQVIGSFSGAISIIRMSVNRRVIRLFKFLYIPKFLFKSEDKVQFLRVFSPWGYQILKEDPYTLTKKLDRDKFKNRYFYASVGEEDIIDHLMLQQWIDTTGRMKKYDYNFVGFLCENEVHTWEYVSRDLKNFLVYFNEKIR